MHVGNSKVISCPCITHTVSIADWRVHTGEQTLLCSQVELRNSQHCQTFLSPTNVTQNCLVRNFLSKFNYTSMYFQTQQKQPSVKSACFELELLGQKLNSAVPEGRLQLHWSALKFGKNMVGTRRCIKKFTKGQFHTNQFRKPSLFHIPTYIYPNAVLKMLNICNKLMHS